ncbi:MAG: hypothetical protein ACRDA4_02055 [Filifactoraceae bacterium]
MLVVFTATTALITPVSYGEWDDNNMFSEEIVYNKACEDNVNYFPSNMISSNLVPKIHSSVFYSNHVYENARKLYTYNEQSDDDMEVKELNSDDILNIDKIDDKNPEREGYEFLGYKFEKEEKPLVTVRFVAYSKDDTDYTSPGKPVYSRHFNGDFSYKLDKMPLIHYINNVSVGETVNISIVNFSESPIHPEYNSLFWGGEFFSLGESNDLKFYRLIDDQGNFIDAQSQFELDPTLEANYMIDNSNSNKTIKIDSDNSKNVVIYRLKETDAPIES